MTSQLSLGDSRYQGARRTEAPRLDVGPYAGGRVGVLLWVLSADAGRQFLIEAELPRAGQAGVGGVGGSVQGDDGRVLVEAGAAAVGHGGVGRRGGDGPSWRDEQDEDEAQHRRAREQGSSRHGLRSAVDRSLVPLCAARVRGPSGRRKTSSPHFVLRLLPSRVVSPNAAGMSYATPTRKASYTPSIPPSEFSSPVLSPSFTRRVSTASSHASPSAATATADRKKRSRLRDYYGLGKAAPAAGAGQALDIGSCHPPSPLRNARDFQTPHGC